MQRYKENNSPSNGLKWAIAFIASKDLLGEFNDYQRAVLRAAEEKPDPTVELLKTIQKLLETVNNKPAIDSYPMDKLEKALAPLLGS